MRSFIMSGPCGRVKGWPRRPWGFSFTIFLSYLWVLSFTFPCGLYWKAVSAVNQVTKRDAGNLEGFSSFHTPSSSTMSYSVFFCLIFASTFHSKFITDGTGMSNIGKSLLLLILEWWPVTAYCLMPSYKMAWDKCLISAQHIIIRAYSLQQHNYFVLAIQGTGFLQSANQNLFNVFRTSKILFYLGGFRAILNEIKANVALNLLYRCSINLLKNLDILIEIT